MYWLNIRGHFYEVDSYGGIQRSKDWKVFAIVPRWNMKPRREYQ